MSHRSTYDHPRRDFASDVLRLQEASLLFSAMAIAKEGIVTFELGTWLQSYSTDCQIMSGLLHSCLNGFSLP